MKTLPKLKKFLDHLTKNPIIDGFSSIEDIGREYQINIDQNILICHAVYDCPPYEGYSTVIWKNKLDGKFYETHGSHCSCYGLEGQWNPEEILLLEFSNRLINGSFIGINIMNQKYQEFIKK